MAALSDVFHCFMLITSSQPLALAYAVALIARMGSPQGVLAAAVSKHLVGDLSTGQTQETSTKVSVSLSHMMGGAPQSGSLSKRSLASLIACVSKHTESSSGNSVFGNKWNERPIIERDLGTFTSKKKTGKKETGQLQSFRIYC